MLESVRRIEMMRVAGGERQRTADALAVEGPLEIRLDFHRDGAPLRTTLAVTMRTPGQDVELAAGFLFTEGIIRDRRDIARIGCCGPGGGTGPDNRLRVELASTVAIDLSRFERRSYTTSSCGACGKTSLEALRATRPWGLPPESRTVSAELLRSLPAALRAAQSTFDATGGLHASALFDCDGRLVIVREDVGRHNALDKVIGAQLLRGALPAHEQILIVSGRVSFELVEKALMAGIPILGAIGAPSSLAVDTAREAGMTLVGFLSGERFNVYCGAERIDSAPASVSNTL